MHLRRLGVVLVAAATALLTLLAIPAPSWAATALPDNEPLVRSNPDVYTFNTNIPYWSGIFVRPSANADYDLALSQNGTMLAASAQAKGKTDFIVIDSNRRPYGPYSATVARYSGSGEYAVQYVQRRTVLSIPSTPNGGLSNVLALSYRQAGAMGDIYLTAGQTFRVEYSPSASVYLVGSTAGSPGTYIRTRANVEYAHVIASPSVEGRQCRVFQAPSSGWYGLVVIWATPWTTPPNPNGGVGAFLQRYNPALGDRPTDCPAPVVG